MVADRCWMVGATAIGQAGAVLEVGFETASAAREAATALRAWRTGLGVAVVDAGPALAAALEAWRPHVRPFRVGRLAVVPAWSPERPAGPQVVVDPARAFGFDHPSTRSCLEAVERWAGEGVGVLDVGSGSGVLAVAAAVLGSSPVVALDVDPAAVEATMSSAVASGVHVDASTAPVGEVPGRFGLVLANIGAETLVRLADDLAPRVAAGGRLVLAGLLAGQAPPVVAAYLARGLDHESTGEREGWTTPVFLRKSGGKSTTATR